MIIFRSTYLTSNFTVTFAAELNFIVYVYYIFIIHSSVDVYMSSFYSYSVLNKSSMSVDMQVSLQ